MTKKKKTPEKNSCKNSEIEEDHHFNLFNTAHRSPGGSTPQSSSCTATFHPSRKVSKLDEPDMRDTAGELISDILL